jgi:hypothetical protein
MECRPCGSHFNQSENELLFELAKENNHMKVGQLLQTARESVLRANSAYQECLAQLHLMYGDARPDTLKRRLLHLNWRRYGRIPKLCVLLSSRSSMLRIEITKLPWISLKNRTNWHALFDRQRSRIVRKYEPDNKCAQKSWNKGHISRRSIETQESPCKDCEHLAR